MALGQYIIMITISIKILPFERSEILRKRCFFIFISLIAFFCVIAEAQNNEAEDRSLVFGGNADFAPYSYISQGKPAGYSVDLVKILSATLNRNIEIELMPWEDCLSGIKDGTLDGLIGAPLDRKLTITMDFSDPVASLDYSIFVKSDSSHINSLESLQGMVVAVPGNSLVLSDISRHKNIEVLEASSLLDALKMLKTNKVKAVIAEKHVALYYIEEEDLQGLKLVGSPVKPAYDYCLTSSRKNEGLIKDLNSAIAALKENGTLNKLQRKWFGIKLVQQFPWKMVLFATSALGVIIFILGSFLWVVSLNATVKAKTRQIQLMSEKMVEKDKLAVLGKLAGQIAHELRTPLSIIKNSVFLLRKEGGEDHKIFEKRLRILDDKVKLSSNILESILSYSRVKAEVASNISVKECVEEVMKDLQVPESIETDVSIKKPESLQVFMDFHQLYSVIRNLCLNAIQAMYDGGKLTIKAFPSEGDATVNIRISDNGPGILESARNKIFHLFYSTKITGTGLGLSISKSIIEANDGSLSLEDSSDEGTSFLIQLPSSRKVKK